MPNMKYQQIQQEIELLANHQAVQNIEKISDLEYHFVFVLKVIFPLNQHSSIIYSNIRWELTFILPKNYPSFPPKLKFQTPIFHLNVSKDGFVCMGILKEEWSGMATLYSVIDELQNILEYPDTTHAASKEFFELFTNNKIQYNQECEKYVQLKKNQISRIQSDGKQEIQQQINDLIKMKLTQFQSIEHDSKFFMPNIKISQTKFDTKISNIFDKSTLSTFKNAQKKDFNFVEEFNQKNSNRIQITNKKISENLSETKKSMSIFDSQLSQQKQYQAKTTKQPNLLSIVQNIKGQQNSNIFDLSASRDEKYIINMRSCRTFEQQENNTKLRQLIPKELKTEKQAKDPKSGLVKNRVSIEFKKSISVEKFQIQQFNQTKNTFQKPNIMYRQFANQEHDHTTKLMHKVSEELWKSIEMIIEIEQNLKSNCAVKSQALDKILRSKLENELENLQRLQNLERQLKQKMIENIQKRICVSVE